MSIFLGNPLSGTSVYSVTLTVRTQVIMEGCWGGGGDDHDAIDMSLSFIGSYLMVEIIMIICFTHQIDQSEPGIQ